MVKPKRVDLDNDPEDQEVALLAELGFSRKLIQEEVGYSPCQIGYRLGLWGMKLADYRNGKNDMARRMLKDARRERVQRHKIRMVANG